MERGVYELSLYVWGPGQEPTEGSGAGAIKYFLVVGPAFPRPTLLKDLVEGCGYIARRNEQAAMDTVTAPQGLRATFDHFWLSLIPDPKRAAAVMRAYFGRVEEASRMFSSYKEGWRTDRGMVYVVFGPPERVEKHLETEIWYYSLPGSSESISFEFRRVYFVHESLTIEDFLLRRNVLYESIWERMVEKWRDGDFY
jgi:GWxTD domain-containing protein